MRSSTVSFAANKFFRLLVSVTCFRFIRFESAAAANAPSSSHSSSAGVGCPKVCFCNGLSQIVYCSRRGLTSLPEGIPAGTLQLNLNGNAFQSGIVGRSNMSHYTGLQHLYMSECGLEQLHVDTFIDLVELRWLDLSNNRLKLITDYTFRGLTLDHLFLNGNRQIQLQPGSLEGLVTVGLYLHDCSIKSVRLDVLTPLNVTLKNLWLNGNELDRIDRSLAGVFSSLTHLRLGSNPLHCGCEAVWLMEFYERNTEVFKGASEPSCAAPLRLRGQHFNQLSLTDFRCQAPIFNNIDIMLSETSGRLKCSATGDPAPTLFWIQPNGRTTKYAPSPHHHQQQQQQQQLSSASILLAPSVGGSTDSDGSRRTDGVLLLKPDFHRQPSSSSLSSVLGGQQHVVATSSATGSPGGGAPSMGGATTVTGASGMYICIANNEAGNVTLAVNVSWPQFANVDRHVTDPSNRGHQLLPSVATPRAVGRPHLDVVDGDTDDGVPLTVNWTAVSRDSDGGLLDEQTGDVSVHVVGEGTSGRLFSIAEMICAVVVTHIATLIVSLVIVAVFVRRRAGKMRRQQQLLPSSLRVAGPSIASGSTAGVGGGMSLGGAGAGGYRLPVGTGSLCRPVPSYTADYAIYDQTETRITPAPFSYHLSRPTLT